MDKKITLTILLLVSFFALRSQNSKIKTKLEQAALYHKSNVARVNPLPAPQSVTYSVNSIAYTPYPFAGDTLIDVDDRWTQTVPIGFNFCYYGTSYDTLVVGANGQVTFDQSQTGGYDGWSISSPLPNTTDMPAATICASFRDIDPSAGGNILYKTLGNAPNRVMTISWVNIPYFDVSTACAGAPPSNFQVALYESTGNIEVNIQNSASCSGWNGGYGIIGVQDQSGTVGVCAPGRNYPAAWTAANEAWQFVPSSTVCHANCGAIPNSICFVSADTAMKNEIFFRHPPGPGITGTIIYRLNAQNNWDSIGYVPVSQPDVFVDPTAIPNQQAYSYCIASTDSCNGVSFRSPAHSTIFLQSNLGTGGSINLTWVPYTGTSIASYYIYRGATPASMTLLNQVNASTTSYTDLSPLPGNNYYKIAIDAPLCNSNAPHDTLVTSNYKVAAPVGIESYNAAGGCMIYPSPTSGVINIVAGEEIEQVIVRDLLGRIQLNEQVWSKKVTVKIEQKGMQLVEVRTAKGIITRRVVVQ